MHAFGGSPGVSGEATTYLRISLFGAPSMLVVLAGTGVLRGLQDTRTPLAVAVAANVGAWGARRAGVGFAPDLTGLRAAAMSGVSLVVRTIALQAVLIVVTAIAARQGNAAIAAHQIAFRAWTLLAFALDAIAIAAQAITGRCPGAGDVAGARAATNRMIGWGMAYGMVFGLLLAAAIPLLPGIFSGGPDVRRLLPAVLLVAAAQQPVAGVVFVLDGLAALWLAFSLWLVARFVTLTLRARSSQWRVTGAVRR